MTAEGGLVPAVAPTGLGGLPGGPDIGAVRVPGAVAGWVFFRQWLRTPLVTAAVAPSSKQLARRMLDAMPSAPRSVVELGAGTGVFTRALLAGGLPPERLLVIERNLELHRLLRRRFPAVQVVHGDAATLPDIARRSGFGERMPVDAILSGLGLRVMPHATQRAILAAAFDVLAPDGAFVQFTYGRSGPVPDPLLHDAGLQVRRSGIAWRNVPPASVFVYGVADAGLGAHG